MANDTHPIARVLDRGARPLMLLLGIAGAVAAGVALVLWLQGPNWSLLYGNLDTTDASRVAQALQAAGIKYKLSESGGDVMVPAGNVHDARLKLAAQSLPEGGRAGLDLISKDSGIGVSQFMETARYQYALEVELARTICALKSVEAARVHLAITQQSAFVRDRRPATASVFVRLRRGGRLEAEQVQAIVHLVASSIPELGADKVTVVDQQGHLLSTAGGTQAAAAVERLEVANRIEETYVRRIEELLVPLVGAGRVRAEVTVDMDSGDTEEAHEQFKPDGVLRSQQTTEESTRGGGSVAAGVPGALTNQPPAGGAVAPPAAAGVKPPAAAAAAVAAAATPESTSKQETRNFEIDRTISYTRHPAGRVKRVSAAVLVDNLHSANAAGAKSNEKLSKAQLDDMTQLVKNIVGFDESRGDNVSVINQAFHDETEVLTPEVTPIWQKPWLQDVAKLGLGALLLLTITLGVLRPLIKNLTLPASSPMTGGEMVVSNAGGHGNSLPGSAPLTGPGQSLAYEQQIVQAKSLASQDPKRAAQMVKTWVSE